MQAPSFNPGARKIPHAMRQPSPAHPNYWVHALEPSGHSQRSPHAATETSVYFSSAAQSCPTLHPHGLQHARPPCPSPTPRSSLKLMPVELEMPSSHLVLCHPLLLPPSIFPSIRVFSNESALCIRWPKYWSFSFIISPSNKYSGLISFRMDWLGLLVVQGTLKSRL